MHDVSNSCLKKNIKNELVETFRTRAKSFWELFPRFEDLESGSYPSLVELGESLTAGFNFEQYCILSLHDEEPYLKKIMSKALAVDPKMFLNNDSDENVDNQNDMSATKSIQQECDEDCYQVPTFFKTVSDQTTVISNIYTVPEINNNVNSQVDLESKNTVDTEIERDVKYTDGDAVLKHKKHVKFQNPEFSIIQQNKNLSFRLNQS